MTLLTQWSPFREMTSLQERVNRMFDESVNGFFGNRGSADRLGQMTRFAPSADVQEDENHLYLDFELPGINEKDVQTTIDLTYKYKMITKSLKAKDVISDLARKA